MQKLVSLICLLLIIRTATAQDKFEKLEKEIAKEIETTQYGRNDSVGKYYNIRGVKMYCEIYGKGEPLLIIHGNGGSINNFIKQIPFFSNYFKVILADSRSQGKTIDKGDSLTYEMMADDLAELLTVLKVDSANVVGWSDGGINGLLLAIRHPEKVKKLAITGANLRPDSTAVVSDILKMIEPDLKDLYAKKNKTENDKVRLKLTKLLLEQPNIPLKDVQKIEVPTLVIGGDHDVIPEAHTVQIYQQLKRGYLWILPNSGHSTPLVYSDDFNRVILNFLKEPFREIQGVKRFF